jgi:hypothetical protein
MQHVCQVPDSPLISLQARRHAAIAVTNSGGLVAFSQVRRPKFAVPAVSKHLKTVLNGSGHLAGSGVGRRYKLVHVSCQSVLLPVGAEPSLKI